MIASWMLYAVAISILITIAAFGLERVGQTRGYATRFVWVGALALSLVWPAWHVVARMLPASPKAASVLPFTIVVYAPATVIDGSESLGRAALIDRGLAALWIAASLLLLARLIAAIRTVERSRAQWRAGSIDGVGVRLSDNVGPAVVGLRSMDVVLPEWILSLDAPLRAIVLCHEEEHRAARDPYLCSRRRSPSSSCPGTSRCGFRRGGYGSPSKWIATPACCARIRLPSDTAC